MQTIAADTPLCVDLDGTLIRTDVLVEVILHVLKRSPWLFFVLPFWLLRGKAYFKRQLALRTGNFPWSTLPYHPGVVSFIHTAKEQGRRVVLATASDQMWAEPIADHLKLFDEVLASDGSLNLKGTRKRDVLVEKFGKQGFSYVADHPCDLAIWSQAAQAIVVNGSRKLFGQVEQINAQAFLLSPKSNRLRILAKALRPHQWVKNILIFVPLVMAHQFLNPLLVFDAVLAFIAFSCCASAGYLVNDLLDLANDRQHATKRFRPLASGELPLLLGLLTVPALLVLGLSTALYLSLPFFALSLLYLTSTFFYSFYGKQLLLIDVLLLAGLYTLRILAGATATEIPLSPWLFAFSMFLFLSLGLVKRFSELYNLRKSGKQEALGRSYRSDDLEALSAFGSSSGYLGVLVLALYVNSSDVKHLYSQPVVLWGLCPVIWFWVSWIWIRAHRGEVHDDPIVFALKDRTTYFVGLAVIVLFVLAKGVSL